MVPTLAATLGVKGHRPVVGTRDCKDVLYVFAVLNLLSGAVHANTLESLQKENRKKTESKTRRMQRAFADHLRHVGRMYPQAEAKRVVLTIDNAPWHRGPLIDEAMRENPHLEFYRMPSYSPQLNVIERFWKKLRRRATHNRLFDEIADLKSSVRNSLRYFQTARSKLLTLIPRGAGERAGREGDDAHGVRDDGSGEVGVGGVAGEYGRRYGVRGAAQRNRPRPQPEGGARDLLLLEGLAGT